MMRPSIIEPVIVALLGRGRLDWTFSNPDSVVVVLERVARAERAAGVVA